MEYAPLSTHKLLNIIFGAALFLLGILFLSRPVFSMSVLVLIAGISLIATGIFKIITAKKAMIQPMDLLMAVYEIIFGILVIVFEGGTYSLTSQNPSIVMYMPYIFAIWLGAFGISRLIQSKKQKKLYITNWYTPLAIGIICLLCTGAIMLSRFVIAMDITTTIIGAFAIMYSFILIAGNIGKDKPLTEIQEVIDENIAKAQNIEYEKFIERLHEDEKK